MEKGVNKILHLVQTIKVEDLNVQSKEGNHLFIDGYVGCYSDYEGCTSMERIKGMIEVSVEGDKITHILSEDLEHIISEYDGVEWEDIILELEDTLRTCFRIVSEQSTL
jgi:hypothetical protein